MHEFSELDLDVDLEADKRQEKVWVEELNVHLSWKMKNV